MAVHWSRSAAFNFALGLALVLLLGSGPPASAQQQPAGHVTVVLGTVEAVSADGEVRRLGRGDAVFEGDTLRSGPRGRAQIRFTDRGVLSLRPDTVLSLDEYHHDDGSPAASRQSMSLDRGGFRARTGGIARTHREGYRVQTPVAVIGIRGTVYDAHQEADGGLLVGSTQGGVEVRTIAGVVGRVGVGESFNYLRVNPDGSIDFLLEPPEVFTTSPELDEGDDDEELDAGAPEDSSVATGSGTSETTAGMETGSGDQFVDLTNDPEDTGTVSPSRPGSGDQPTTVPIPLPGDRVLTPEQIEALLADDRVGLVLGVPSVSVDADGNVVAGAPSLQGGIATFNSPLLALSSARGGLGTGITGAAREDLLSEADLFLLPGSAESEAELDVAGVSGLIWGRYLSPVTLFVDPDDGARVLELERDILFMLGTPTDIAVLEGLHVYELDRFDITTSGLPVADVFASGVLDVTNARYTGLIDILLGGEGDLSLFAEFQSQVSGGVLEGITFGTLDLFDFATETAVDAEGELAGFFTGDAAAFLQLAFDFRVPSRTDADVAGLALLARTGQLATGPLTAAQESALVGGDALALATGIAVSDTDMAGLLAGGIGVLHDGAPVLALATDRPGFPADVASADREELLGSAGALLTDASGTFELEQGVGGVAGLSWGRFEAPATQYLDAGDADALVELDRDLLFALGTPTDLADLDGAFFYQLSRSEVVTGGMPVTGVMAEGLLDLGSGRYFGALDVLFDDGGAGLELLSDFEGSVVGGVLEALLFEALILRSLDGGGTHEVEGTLAGFFTGELGAFLQLAFDYRVPTMPDADVAGLALLTRVEDIPDGALTPEEAVLLAEGRVFVGADCCFFDDGRETTVFAGFATDPRPSDGEAAILGVNVDGDGGALDASDPAFLKLLPDSVVRRGEAATLFEDELDLPGDLAAFAWWGDEGPALGHDARSGEILRSFNEQVLVLSGTPADVANLTGTGRYTLETLVQGFYLDEAGFLERTALPFAQMSFNVDFSDGAVTDGLFRAPVDLSGMGMAQEGEGGVIFGSHLEAFFTGQVALDNGNAFVDFDLTSGGLWYAEAPADPLDLDRSSLGGFFTGEQGEHFAAAFHLQTEGENFLDDGLDPILVIGSAVLARRDLSLAEAEAALFGDALWGYAAAACCTSGVSAGAGLATDGTTNAVLGLTPSVSATDPAFLDLPQQLLRRAGAPGGQLIPETSYLSDLAPDLRMLGWFGEDVASLRVDAQSGEILQRFDDLLLFQVGQPRDVADLQAVGFTTFAGTEVGDPSQAPAEHVGFTGEQTSTFANASFNVDLASGEIFAGHLFVGDAGGSEGPGHAFEQGFTVFFGGQVGYDGGNSFVELALLDGHYHGGTALDLEASSIEGFLTGSEDGLVFAGSYALQTDETEPLLASGVFRVANVILDDGFLVPVEMRLDAAEVAAWDRFAIAAFRGAPFSNVPGDGLLMGRSGRALQGEAFVMGADAPRLFDDGLVLGDTRRSDFLAQPFEYVLRQGQAPADRFEVDVRPDGAPSFAGFEIDWGAWEDIGSGTSPFVQFAPRFPSGERDVGPEVFFASVNPTPIAQLADLTATVAYGGAVAAIGGGGGDLSGFVGARFPLETMDVGFTLDFASGLISNGFIDVEYFGFSGIEVRWEGEFEGFLNGAITDLTLTALTVAEGIEGTFSEPFDADLGHSNLTGILTGPEGQRHLGGFSFVMEDFQTEQFESVEGLWVIDQLPGGTP